MTPWQRDPLSYAVLTQPQTEWVRMGSPADPDRDARPLLWRGANQIGKSYAQAAKILHFLRRTGPYATRKPGPVNVMVVSISKEQIEPLMAKLWDLMPKHEAPKAEFSPGFGFRGKPPRILFESGPAAGSLITFATYSQGSTRIAGATVDVVVLDEPPPEEMWGEVVLRVQRRAGQVWCSMTITPDSPPQEWMRDLVHGGAVRELHTPLTQEALRPINGMPPFLSRSALAAWVAAVPEAEKPLRIAAEWTGATVDRWLSAWSRQFVQPVQLPPGCQAILSLDHGIRIGRQAAILSAHQPSTGRFWVIDESAGGSVSTSSQDDAANIAAMLARNGASWEHVDLWIGDRSTASIARDVRKDNSALRRYLAAHYKVEIDRFPRINVPYKAAGTLHSGFRNLNALLAAGKLVVDPRCTHLIESFERWNGDKRSPYKDALDALRYGIESAALATTLQPATLAHVRTR